MAASALSPSSSPRLPSPPPITEDQLGPKSPIPTTDEQHKHFSNLDHGAARRIRPGTKAEDMAEGPPLVDLTEIDSAFQLTEHLKALHYSLTHPDNTNGTIAVDKDIALKLAQPPDNVDKTLWLYELCRFLTLKANSIITALFSDSPPCSSNTCPEMRASEWQYLCAVHDPPKSCCAIDYCCHTLDWAANTLTSPKTFPSRLALGTDQTTQHQQIRQLTNIFRRVYRIFAHAWFQHRDMFWKVENRSGLYILFKTVCDLYGLIPEENYTIPPEAEGIEAAQPETAEDEQPQPVPPVILRREPSDSGAQDTENTPIIEGVTDHILSTAGTTKRHRHSPSVGATAVSTVVEESEEDDDAQSRAESVVTAVQTEEPLKTDESAGEDSAASEEPSTTEQTESAEEPAGTTSSKTSNGTEQSEQTGASEVAQGDGPAIASEKESETPVVQTNVSETNEADTETDAKQDVNSDAETDAKPEPSGDIEAEVKGEEPTPSSEAEETAKDEPAADAEKATDVKQPGEKPGSDE